MKHSTILLLAGLACILLLVAGCTTTPTTPPAATPTPTATATATAAPTTGPHPAWTGNWNTTWTEENETFSAPVTLLQNGTSVTGTYDGGTGTMSGAVDGSRLLGTWSETFENETASGAFEFVLSADLNSFAGKWADTAAELPNSTETWNGVRV